MRDDAVIQTRCFADIDVHDSFFDSLKESYPGFEGWFLRKSGETAYVVYDDENALQGFMYLKQESGPVVDIEPPLNARQVLKVGTFKINAHGTRLSERFVKKIFDFALSGGLSLIYVTVFDKHVALIDKLEAYGFARYGTKTSAAGIEQVFVKDFSRLSGQVALDYPVVDARECNKWLLAIKPEFHTRLFPDSLLRTEDPAIVEDLSYANSIHKAYVSYAPAAEELKAGDVVVMYRMADAGRSAEYSSVATSICTVESVRLRQSFVDEDAFVDYCRRNSVFSINELRDWYRKARRGSLSVIRLVYNLALPKRPIRKNLIEDAKLDREARWTLMQLSDAQFKAIADMGRVYEGAVIHKAGVC